MKLLTFLDDKEVKRIGQNIGKQVDVRIISATNSDLYLAVKEKRFREDLFYRLVVATIEMSPLRERREDIPLLINHFLSEFQSKYQRGVPGFTDFELTEYMKHNWPGNVRELRNAIEGIVVAGVSPLEKLDELIKRGNLIYGNGTTGLVGRLSTEGYNGQHLRTIP